MANNIEVRIAGSAALANNLAARLDGVRDDALYAKVLFLFLGAPGVVLAALVTAEVAGAGRPRRKREQALLRIRGATLFETLTNPAVEAAVIGACRRRGRTPRRLYRVAPDGSERCCADCPRLGLFAAGRNLRKLLVVGAHAVLFHRKPHTDPLRMWAKKLIEKKPFKLVAVALANKMARIAFAILRSKTVYREIPA